MIMFCFMIFSFRKLIFIGVGMIEGLAIGLILRRVFFIWVEVDVLSGDRDVWM